MLCGSFCGDGAGGLAISDQDAFDGSVKCALTTDYYISV